MIYFYSFVFCGIFFEKKFECQWTKTIFCFLFKLLMLQVFFRKRGNVSVIKWRDKQKVCILSKIHDPMKKVPMRTRHATREKLIAVRDYSQNMSGCDHSDQFHAYIPLRRRSIKWWKKLFIYLYVLSLNRLISYTMRFKRRATANCHCRPFSFNWDKCWRTGI